MHLTTIFALSLPALLSVSCGKKPAAKVSAASPVEVTFSVIGTEDLSITRELPGRIQASRVAEIRARAAGILLEKSFREGEDIKAGAVLFRIDPAPLQAENASAKAKLARAEAILRQAEVQAARFQALVAVRAVSKQEAENSQAAIRIAATDVLAAKADVATTELSLDYATVVAPISGRIGKADVTEGALVGQGTATRLAIIQQLDPIFFDFAQPSGDLIALKHSQADHEKVTLLLEDGSEYDEPGKLLFSETTVDETTGMVLMRAEFKNPNRDLLPGMFARSRIVQAIKKDAITVPQRAVTRGPSGTASVMVIDASNHAQTRMIQTGEAIGDKWIVSSGLAPGEKVIIEGLLKARPGAALVPSAFSSATKETASAINRAR